MPNADRLAREGLRFTDVHSTSAVCTPRATRFYRVSILGARAARVFCPTLPCSSGITSTTLNVSLYEGEKGSPTGHGLLYDFDADPGER